MRLNLNLYRNFMRRVKIEGNVNDSDGIQKYAYKKTT